MKNIEFKRKRQGKTDFKQRLKLLKGKKLRLVVRKSLKNITAQIVEYHPDGDKVLSSANSRELLKKYGWKGSRNNIPASYLTGYLLGKYASKAKITEAVLDIGSGKSVKGSKLYAVLKGAVDAGLKVPCKNVIFPSEDMINGTTIAKYGDLLLKENNYEKIFCGYTKKGIKASDLPKIFEETKKKIE